jgi:hypothetical protein
MAVQAIAIAAATLWACVRILATLPTHPDGCAKRVVFAAKKSVRLAGETLQPVQPSLHSDSVPPRTPNPWPEAKERGTQVVGANPAVIREKRRLFQR